MLELEANPFTHQTTPTVCPQREFRSCTLDCRFKRNGRSLGTGCPCLPPFGSRTADCPCANVQQRHSCKPPYPEAMVETDINETCFAIPTDTDDYQAVGIGPGLGRNEETEAALLEQLGTLPDSCSSGCRRTQHPRQPPPHTDTPAEGFYPHPTPEGTGTADRQVSGFIRTTDQSLRTGSCRQRTYHPERRLFRHYHPRRENVISTQPEIREWQPEAVAMY